MKTHKHSEEFLKIVSEVFQIDIKLFDFNVTSRTPDIKSGNFLSWNLKITHKLFNAAVYESQNSVLSLNLMLHIDLKYDFNKLWSNFIERLSGFSSEYEIENKTKVSSIRNSNLYVLVKEVNETNIILSITIGHTY